MTWLDDFERDALAVALTLSKPSKDEKFDPSSVETITVDTDWDPGDDCPTCGSSTSFAIQVQAFDTSGNEYFAFFANEDAHDFMKALLKRGYARREQK